MKVTKRILAFLLCLALSLAMALPVFAEEQDATVDALKEAFDSIENGTVSVERLTVETADMDLQLPETRSPTTYNSILFNVNTIGQGAVIGDTMKLRTVLFSFGSSYQKYNIYIYYGDASDGTLVGSVDGYYSSTIGTKNHTTTWNTSGKSAGKYTVYVFTSYYSGGKWNIASSTVQSAPVFLLTSPAPMTSMSFYDSSADASFDAVTIQKNESRTFTMRFEPLLTTDDHDVNVTNSDPSVATIEYFGGVLKVEAVGVGTATITASTATVSAALLVTVPAPPHTCEYVAEEHSATCTEDAHILYTCSICGASYRETISPALGHEYGEWTQAKAPSCTEAGEETRTCSRCNGVDVRELAVLGHEYGEWTQTKAPTCTGKGEETRTCSRCSNIETRETAALGHSYVNGICSTCGARKDCDGGADCPSGKFTDVSAKNWFHEAVDFAVERGLFGGTSANTFEPDTPMTRAMLVTVLWRYEGEPDAPANTFSDVKAGTWYSDAVSWASVNGVVNGVGSNKFDPEGNITREQMATILYRYCSGKGIDTSKQGSLSGFPDADKVSSYALTAMQWTVAEGIIGGSDGKLLPQGNATRAQVATILMRFIENIA